MLRLILVRHGNTFEIGQTPLQIGARTDLPLTEQGREQGKQMAEYLRKEKIPVTALFAGSLKRQTEFATILGEVLKLKFLSEMALNEIDYGAWEGLPSEEIADRWPNEYADWNQKRKWPENIFIGSHDEHKGAIENWLESLKKTYLDGCVVAVTSNGLLRFFQNEKIKTGHFCEFELAPEGLRAIRLNVLPT